MTDQEFHLRKLIEQLERENAALRWALNKIANDPAPAVTYYEEKWQWIAREVLKSNA